MFNLIVALLFLAQPATPYEMLGSPKYSERELAISYLSRKDVIDEELLYKLADSSTDEEVRKNAEKILDEKFRLYDIEAYPAIAFMGLYLSPYNSITYPAYSLREDVFISKFIRDYIVKHYPKESNTYLNFYEQKKLTQKLVFELRTKYRMSKDSINLWLTMGLEAETKFKRENEYWQYEDEFP